MSTTTTPTDSAVADDPEIQLMIPEGDVADPEVSIVIPALNEELTITDFVAFCHEGLAAAGVRGEILIVDSSTDRTPELAVAAGARVLQVPKRGLGRAYMDAIPYIRGPWVLMGDADCTYDFRLLEPFIARFREGCEYVMGSRWKGSIEKGAMPSLHQYFGTPGTTWILNRLYGSRFSDIHCGMRGITRDALVRLDLHSQSWEYASEMVLKSVHMELRTAEVPVRFLKDRDGRLSHHKRSGWFSPWSAAWINLRAMFVYGADFFLFKPGIILLLLGALLTIPTAFGNIEIGPVTLSLYWMLAGLAATVLGANCFFMGIIAQILFDYTGRATRRWSRAFAYTRTALIAFGLIVAGIALAIPLVSIYLSNDLRLGQPEDVEYHLAVTGLTMVIAGFQLFTFALLLHGSIVATTRGRPRSAVAKTKPGSGA
jgi:glycosyltransferase involved in cell wall biosynthesis